jgi:hypothetical protein
VTTFVVLFTPVILPNCLPVEVETQRQAEPSVATPERSGLSATKLTVVPPLVVDAPDPVNAVAGPAPLAAASDPVVELN